jgi:hypothetical protein
MNIRKSSKNNLSGFAELVRSGHRGSVHVLSKAYWAGEHTFTHCANQAENDRGHLSDLWVVDIYTRKGIDPIKHSKRVFIWANNEKSAINEANRFADEGITVLVTHIKPLEDKLRDPAIF